MLYIKLFIEREKNIGQSAPECPFKFTLGQFLHVRYALVVGKYYVGPISAVSAVVKLNTVHPALALIAINAAVWLTDTPV